MKKNIVSRVLALLLLMTCYSAYGYSGYYAPYEGTKCITQGWDGKYSHGIANGSNPKVTTGAKLAYAIDIGGTFNVLAVKDGEVVDSGWHDGFGKHVIVKHSDGLYSQYVHLEAISITSGIVKRGMVLGKSGNTGSYAPGGAHLHLQMTTTKHLISTLANTVKVNFQGFKITEVDTLSSRACSSDQWKKSLNKVYQGNGSSTNNSNSSVFDGAGSLIDPDTQCAGCNFDIAKMHPHAPLKSTVVFQWLFDDLSCQFINLTTNSNKELPVSIHLKKWDAHETQTAYKTTLYSDTSISIAKEGEGDWTTFAVTSQQPIKDAIEITASCEKSSADHTQPQDRENIPLDLVDVGLGNYWTGTGSIISKAKTRTGFGVNKDYAVTFSKHKSLTSFQWYASSICKSVTVRDIKTPTKKIKASVAIKMWDSKTFDNVCDSLPCTLVEKPQRWYVIKVKTAKGAVSSGGLETICN